VEGLEGGEKGQSVFFKNGYFSGYDLKVSYFSKKW
jgi:hypothetical protein